MNRELFVKYKTLIAMAEKQLSVLKEDESEEKVLPLLVEIAITETELKESGVLTGLSSLERSRIMRRPSTRAKLKKAAERVTKKKKRLIGLTKYLRKSGSKSRPSKAGATAQQKLKEERFIQYSILDPYVLTEREKEAKKLKGLKKFPIEFELADIQHILVNHYIPLYGFFSQFGESPPDGDLEINDLVEKLYKENKKKVNEIFYNQLRKERIFVDPILSPLTPMLHEGTETTDIANTIDPLAFRLLVRKDNKRRYAMLKLNGFKFLTMAGGELTEDERDLVDVINFYRDNPHMVTLEMPEIEEFIQRVDEELEPLILEASFPKDSIVKMKDGTFGMVHGFLGNLKAFLVTNLDTGETILQKAGNIAKIVTTKGRQAISRLLEDESINEAMSAVAQIGFNIVHAVESGEVNNEKGYKALLKILNTKENQAKVSILHYFAEEDISRNVSEAILNMLSIYASKTIPKDLDIFTAQVMQSNEALNRNQQIVMWIGKTIFGKTKKPPKLIKQLFSLKIFWALLVALYLFARQSGLIRLLLTKYAPKTITNTADVIPDKVKKKIKVPDTILNKFTRFAVDKVIGPKLEATEDTYEITWKVTKMYQLFEASSDRRTRLRKKAAELKAREQEKKEIEQIRKRMKATTGGARNAAIKRSPGAGRKAAAISLDDLETIGIPKSLANKILKVMAYRKYIDGNGVVNTKAIKKMDVKDFGKSFVDILQPKMDDIRFLADKSIEYQNFLNLGDNEKRGAIWKAWGSARSKDEAAVLLGMSPASMTAWKDSLGMPKGIRGRKKHFQTNALATWGQNNDSLMDSLSKLFKSLKVMPLITGVGTIVGGVKTLSGDKPKTAQEHMQRMMTATLTLAGLASTVGLGLQTLGNQADVLAKLPNQFNDTWKSFVGIASPKVRSQVFVDAKKNIEGLTGVPMDKSSENKFKEGVLELVALEGDFESLGKGVFQKRVSKTSKNVQKIVKFLNPAKFKSMFGKGGLSEEVLTESEIITEGIIKNIVTGIGKAFKKIIRIATSKVTLLSVGMALVVLMYINSGKQAAQQTLKDIRRRKLTDEKELENVAKKHFTFLKDKSPAELKKTFDELDYRFAKDGRKFLKNVGATAEEIDAYSKYRKFLSTAFEILATPPKDNV